MVRLIILLSLLAVSTLAWCLQFTGHKVEVSEATYRGKEGLRVIPSEGAEGEDKLAILDDTTLTNGTIEAFVSGDLLEGAGPGARGFVGIAFRIADDVSSYEAVYLRPTNGRADDQLRRNHSVQYVSFPDYPWHRLREESPGQYETYADMAPGDWIHCRLEIDGTKLQLYLNHAEYPTFIVNDLKLGERGGGVGLWVGPGTDAHFAEIKVTPK
jgi:hypothetical protein